MAKKRRTSEQSPSLFPTMPTAYGIVPLPRAHRADPSTSHESAAKVAKSARAALHREIAMAIVAAHPGHTGMELWELATS
jgi:hypothetical protein